MRKVFGWRVGLGLRSWQEKKGRKGERGVQREPLKPQPLSTSPFERQALHVCPGAVGGVAWRAWQHVLYAGPCLVGKAGQIAMPGGKELWAGWGEV